MPAFGAVGGVAAAEIMAPDDARKAATLGDANGIHKIADGKQAGTDEVAGLDGLGEVAEFANSLDAGQDGGRFLPRAFGVHAEFLQVAEFRLGEALIFLFAKAELDGVVAVGGLGFTLQHAIGSGEDNGHRMQDALGVVDPRLSQFFSKKSERHNNSII